MRSFNQTKCWRLKVLSLAQVVTFLFIFSLVTPDSNAQSCGKGWFGENCMYKCNCPNKADCDSSGTCPEHKCPTSYFGDGCQFLDLVMSKSDPTTESYIRDGDNTTCNPNAAATSVEVKLNAPFQFLWFRIEVNEIDNRLNFTIVINDDKECTNAIIYPGHNDVDVRCETTIPLQSLRITGPIAPDVCSVYISAGRNVALKQSAQQSSVLLGHFSVGASNAVDGNLENSYQKDSCAHTRAEDRPWWRLKFNRPQILLNVHITNHAGDRAQNLQGFNLLGYGGDGALVMEYNGSGAVLANYNVPWTSKIPVLEIIIKGKNAGVVAFRYLAICEFQTMGETVCPKETYGLWCGEKCHCIRSEDCSQVTGVCAFGCKIGFYGTNCLHPCRRICLGGYCTQTDGKCIECPPGYTGDYCETECANGFFGANCKNECSPHCNNICDNKDGECICTKNFTGPTCSACVPGKHGVNCTEPCSKLCTSDGCTMTSGACLSCPKQRSGNLCEGCSSMYYGSECDSQCSLFCVNGTCNNQTGNCLECVQGFSGEQCNTSAEQSEIKLKEEPTFSISEQVMASLMLVCPIAGMSCMSMFWCMRRAAAAPEDE